MGYLERHDKFKSLIQKFKTLKSSARKEFIWLNVINQQIIDLSHSDETFMTVAVQTHDDESNVEILELLREYGADINYIDPHGRNLLYHAMEFSCANTKTISYLLDNLTNVRLSFSEKVVKDKCFEGVLELYLQKGFKIDSNDNNRLLALVKYGCGHLLPLLVRLGVDINGVDSGGDNILMSMLKGIINDDDNLVEQIKHLVLNGLDINYVNGTCSSWMLLVRLKNNSSIKYVEELLISVPILNINMMDSEGNTALKYTVRNHVDNIAILKILLEKGAETKGISLEDFGYDSLFPSKIKLLLAYGMEIHNINNMCERTIIDLIRINDEDSQDFLKMLLMRDDIDINYTNDDNGTTFLYNSRNNIKVTKLLLNYGADYLAKCKVDVTWGGCQYPRTFLANLDLCEESHRKIYKIIQEIEFGKKCRERFIFPSIKTIYAEFTLNPSSIYSKTMAIKWDLERMDKDKVYVKYKEDPLMAYYGINDGDILRAKILDQLKN